MTTLRSLAGAFALGTFVLILASHDAAAQGKDKGLKGGNFSEAYVCEICGKDVQTIEGVPPSVCPFCGAKYDVTKKSDGTYSVKFIETSENKWKKPLIYGGGILFVVGIIGVALKYTVFAPAPPKKKKPRRDDDGEDDDRPRKKKRPAAEDDDEDRPRKVKKPRIVEEDED